MTEEEWLSATHLDPLLTRAFGLKGRPLRQEALFACGCLRCAQDWRLPDDAADVIETTERYHDGDLSRRTWLKYRRPFEAKHAAHVRAARWEFDFRSAVIGLFYPSPGWTVADALLRSAGNAGSDHYRAAFEGKLCNLLRDIYGNPFRPVAFDPAWRTDTAVAIARTMYESREFSGMPILADALQDAGCDNDAVLSHCRDATLTHVRGCWVVDLVLGKA